MTHSASVSTSSRRLINRALLQDVFDLQRDGKFTEANAALTRLEAVIREQKQRQFTVADVLVVDGSRYWTTKSKAQLFVHLRIPHDVNVATFQAYDADELASIANAGGQDIRGIRTYAVNEIQPGQVGGTEFHRIREEIITCTAGRLRWTVNDLAGGERVFDLKPGQSVWMPPFIMHTYEALDVNTCLSVLCNTLFHPEDKRTHDTYGHDDWKRLRLPPA
jgi:mannose-6-phosphate isomerase-like protein (cupin superfamily)